MQMQLICDSRLTHSMVWQVAYDYALTRWENIAAENATSHYPTPRAALASLASVVSSRCPILQSQLQHEEEYGTANFLAYLEKRARLIYHTTSRELLSDLEANWRSAHDNTY